MRAAHMRGDASAFVAPLPFLRACFPLLACGCCCQVDRWCLSKNSQPLNSFATNLVLEVNGKLIDELTQTVLSVRTFTV